MPSWRDSTPQAAQDDLDAMLSTALDAALHLLTKNGEFFPFGVTVGTAGQVGLAAADPDLGDHPESTAVLADLYADAAENRDTYRAMAFVSDVTANDSNAVRVEAGHRDGGPGLVIVMPYIRKGIVKKVVTYGQMAAGGGERRVWP